MSTISLRLNKKEDMLIKKYAELTGVTTSELFRQAVFEKIEDEYDLIAYQKATEEYQNDSVVFSIDEVEVELGLR